MFRAALVPVCLALVGAVAAPTAFSQTVIYVAPPAVEAPSPEAAAPAAAASPYSDDELHKFAGAAVVLQRINDDVVPKLESAATTEEQQELAQAAALEMVQAVERNGMSVDRFQEILWQAQTNPVVAQQVVRHMQSMLQ